MKLIDKDALVEEIQRLKEDGLQKRGQCKRSGLEKIMHQIGAYNKILSFLDTLEVKEVDLEKELNDYGYHYDYVSLADRKELMDFAKHFFELALSLKNN